MRLPLVLVVVALVAGCDSGASAGDTPDAAAETCDFGDIDVVAYTGPAITTTAFECTPADASDWMCGWGSLDALIYLTTLCDPAADERVVEIRYSTEAPMFARIWMKLDATGTPIAAGAISGDLGSSSVPQSGTLAIEGGAITGDCVRGSLALTYSDYSIDGTFRTQACPR